MFSILYLNIVIHCYSYYPYINKKHIWGSLHYATLIGKYGTHTQTHTYTNCFSVGMKSVTIFHICHLHRISQLWLNACVRLSDCIGNHLCNTVSSISSARQLGCRWCFYWFPYACEVTRQIMIKRWASLRIKKAFKPIRIFKTFPVSISAGTNWRDE